MSAAGMPSLNHYDRHRVICSCDDKKQADLLSGHQWNIINNRTDHEVYYKHARSNDHYLDENGRVTGHWFQQKRRIDLDGDGIIECVDSTNVQEVLVCPPTAGKEAQRERARHTRQLCQAAAPRNYNQYSARRATSIAAPPTPLRESSLMRTAPREKHQRPTPRLLERRHWTPRRGMPQEGPRPPREHDMFRAVDQLRAESHIDATDANFAEALGSARATANALRGSGRAGSAAPPALAGATATRSMLHAEADVPAKPAEARVRHSTRRVEPVSARQITGWEAEPNHRLKRDDPFYVRPVQQSGSSSVKYDIFTNERKQFWY